MYHQMPPFRSPVHEDHQGEGAVTAPETLVADTRTGVTPAQMVERKLVSLLQGKPLPLSLGQMTHPLRTRT
jgi:hypothetical protein